MWVLRASDRRSLVLAATVAVILPTPAHAGHSSSDSGPVARIVWQTTEYDRAALRTRDTTGQQHEVSPQEWNPGATLSPDGTRVAFTRIDPASGLGRLWVAKVDGSEQHPIAPDGLGRNDLGSLPAVWSPDGTQILSTNAYTEDDGSGTHYGQRELYVLDARGQAPPRLLVRNSAGINWYVWSPDSATVAYTDNRDRSLHIVDTVTLQHRRLGGGRVEAWSPDGAHLLINDSPRLVELDLVTGRAAVLREQIGLSSPSYSPDGSTIGFAGYSDTDDHLYPTAVYAAARDGSNKRMLQRGELTGPLRWGPDGALYWRRYGGLDENGRRASTIQTHSTAADGLPARRLDIGQSGWFDIARAQRRLAGVSREATAASVSRAQFPTSDHVVLTRSDDYPDALAAGPLAAALQAPLLLTKPGALEPATAREMNRLGATRVTIVGSDAAVSLAVERDLRARGLTLERISGVDRFDTAAQIARRLSGRSRHAYVVAGVGTRASSGWADAASVSAVASHTGSPILLARPDSLPAATEAGLSELDMDAVTIVGGTQAVSERVAESLRALVGSVDRLAGSNRYETSVRVAERGVALGLSAQRPWIMTGAAFADALSGGPAAALTGNVALLVAPDQPATSSSSWLRSAPRDYVTVVGGPAAVGPTVAFDATGVKGP